MSAFHPAQVSRLAIPGYFYSLILFIQTIGKKKGLVFMILPPRFRQATKNSAVDSQLLFIHIYHEKKTETYDHLEPPLVVMLGSKPIV